MCNTVQYLFRCGHSATHRFRSGVCEIAKSRDCCTKDHNKYISGLCKRCEGYDLRWQYLSSLPSPMPEEKFDDIWYIPSRCFINVGFRTLDPFGTEKEETDALSPTQAVPLLATPAQKAQSLWTQFGSKNDKGPGQRLMDRIRRPKQPSPCCATETEYGAFQATRLEGCGDRVEGRIMDSHCESMK